MTAPAASAKPFLHLLPGLLCDASIWAHQIEALSVDYDVRTADFRSFDDLTAMARKVLAESAGRFSVAGHSMGARVALEVVRLAPKRVERLALLDTGVHPRREGEAEKRQVLVDLAERDGMAALADLWLPPMVFAEGPRTAEIMPGLKAMVQRMSPAIHARQIKALLNRPDAERGLAAISCPVLLGVGKEDAWSPPAQHEAMAAHIPHARLVVFPKAGHMTPLEAPEAVTNAMRIWLAEPSRSEV